MHGCGEAHGHLGRWGARGSKHQLVPGTDWHEYGPCSITSCVGKIRTTLCAGKIRTTSCVGKIHITSLCSLCMHTRVEMAVVCTLCHLLPVLRWCLDTRALPSSSSTDFQSMMNVSKLSNHHPPFPLARAQITKILLCFKALGMRAHSQAFYAKLKQLWEDGTIPAEAEYVAYAQRSTLPAHTVNHRSRTLVERSCCGNCRHAPHSPPLSPTCKFRYKSFFFCPSWHSDSTLSIAGIALTTSLRR